MHPTRIAVLVLALAVVGVRAAEAETDGAPWYRGKLTAAAGFSYTEGDYGGSADTQVWYLPFSLKYSFRELGLTRWDRIDLKATIPYLRLTGPEGATFDFAGDIIPGTGSVATHDGLGDVSVSAKYVYVSGARRPVFGLATKLQIPTGDESEGLGSGNVNLTVGVEASQTFALSRGVQLTPFAEVGYRWREDRRDQIRASGGFSVRPHDRFDIGLSYQFSERSSAGSSDRHELSPFASFRITDSLSLAPFGILGLSRSSADFGAGLMLGASFRIPD